MTVATIVAIAVVAIGYLVQFFVSSSKSKKHMDEVIVMNKEENTKIFNDLRIEVIKEIGSVSSTLTTETAVIGQQIKTLEEKQDKHNGMIEKTYKNESSTSSAHKRLDGMKEDMKCMSSGIGKLETICTKLMALK